MIPTMILNQLLQPVLHWSSMPRQARALKKRQQHEPVINNTLAHYRMDCLHWTAVDSLESNPHDATSVATAGTAARPMPCSPTPPDPCLTSSRAVSDHHQKQQQQLSAQGAARLVALEAAAAAQAGDMAASSKQLAKLSARVQVRGCS
jgi:hypothetical protein